MSERAAGILMPISSLPSEYGIGCFSKSAYEFVDWTKKSRTELLADSAAWSYKLRRFSVSVVFNICGQSIFHQSGGTGGRRRSEQKQNVKL